MPLTSTRLGPLASIRKRQGAAEFCGGARSVGRLISRVLTIGSCSAAAERPSRQLARSIASRPAITPPIPSELISSGPVRLADISSRPSSRALRAASRRSIPGPRSPSRERSKLPLPATLPPPGVWPDRLLSTNRDPENAPRTFIASMVVPVSELCNRKVSLASEPRMAGEATDPVASAATDSGPVRSNASIAASRQSASAGPL